ncbi:hypothetical protein QUC31_008229 [Theobroma cacao]
MLPSGGFFFGCGVSLSVTSNGWLATAYDKEFALMHSKKTELEQSNEFTERQSEESTGKPSYELNRKNLAIIAASVIWNHQPKVRLQLQAAWAGLVPKGKRGLTTRKLTAAKHLNSNNGRNDTNLGSDIRSGFLTLTSHSKMNGKVHLMSLGKQRKANGRRRSAEMNCTLTVNLAKTLVQDIKCS